MSVRVRGEQTADLDPLEDIHVVNPNHDDAALRREVRMGLANNARSRRGLGAGRLGRKGGRGGMVEGGEDNAPQTGR